MEENFFFLLLFNTFMRVRQFVKVLSLGRKKSKFNWFKMVNFYKKKKITSVTISYHRLPSVTIGYHRLPSVTISYHRLPSVIIGYHRLPSVTIGYHRLPSVTISYHQFIGSSVIILPFLPKLTIFNRLNLFFSSIAQHLQFVICFSCFLIQPSLLI